MLTLCHVFLHWALLTVETSINCQDKTHPAQHDTLKGYGGTNFKPPTRVGRIPCLGLVKLQDACMWLAGHATNTRRWLKQRETIDTRLLHFISTGAAYALHPAQFAVTTP